VEPFDQCLAILLHIFLAKTMDTYLVSAVDCRNGKFIKRI